MTRAPFAWLRLVWKKRSAAKRQPQRYSPQVEELEDRVVPSFFPSTTNGIHIFEDQLPTGMSSAMVQFLATHTDGTQKELLSTINQFRAINPNYTLLHYQLGTGNSAYDYIINDQWSSDFSYVNQQESWVRTSDLFRRAAIGGRPRQRPGRQQHWLVPGRHRQFRLATVHIDPGSSEHGGH
jgi:hypothetical protein